MGALDTYHWTSYTIIPLCQCAFHEFHHESQDNRRVLINSAFMIISKGPRTHAHNVTNRGCTFHPHSFLGQHAKGF